MINQFIWFDSSLMEVYDNLYLPTQLTGKLCFCYVAKVDIHILYLQEVVNNGEKCAQISLRYLHRIFHYLSQPKYVIHFNPVYEPICSNI